MPLVEQEIREWWANSKVFFFVSGGGIHRSIRTARARCGCRSRARPSMGIHGPQRDGDTDFSAAWGTPWWEQREQFWWALAGGRTGAQRHIIASNLRVQGATS